MKHHRRSAEKIFYPNVLWFLLLAREPGTAWSDPALPDALDPCLQPGTGAEPGHEAGGATLYGPVAEVQLAGDGLVGKPDREKLQDLPVEILVVPRRVT
jgi:hypothetical protein